MVGNDFQEGIYIFQVTVGNSWRRISIPGDQVLDSLSDAILDAFNFDHNHFFQFKYRNRKGLTVIINVPEMEDPPFTTEVLIGELALEPGQILDYLYDFGDCWEFEVVLEKIDKEHTEATEATILESYGESPKQYVYYDELDEDW